MNRRKTFALCAALLCALLVAGGVSAMSRASYDLSWWTVDGGGATFSEGGGYELSGTIGQPDAGPVLEGGNYRLVGGFWAGAAAVRYTFYLPLVVQGR